MDATSLAYEDILSILSRSSSSSFKYLGRNLHNKNMLLQEKVGLDFAIEFVQICLVSISIGAITPLFWRNHNQIKQLLVYVDVSLSMWVLAQCALSIMLDQLVEGHYLLVMTERQRNILLVVLVCDCIELGLCLHGIKHNEYWELLSHHGLSVLGIGYELYIGLGGGIMVRFLLDSTTHFFALVEDLMSKRSILCC